MPRAPLVYLYTLPLLSFWVVPAVMEISRPPMAQTVDEQSIDLVELMRGLHDTLAPEKLNRRPALDIEQSSGSKRSRGSSPENDDRSQLITFKNQRHENSATVHSDVGLGSPVQLVAGKYQHDVAEGCSNPFHLERYSASVELQSSLVASPSRHGPHGTVGKDVNEPGRQETWCSFLNNSENNCSPSYQATNPHFKNHQDKSIENNISDDLRKKSGYSFGESWASRTEHLSTPPKARSDNAVRPYPMIGVFDQDKGESHHSPQQDLSSLYAPINQSSAPNSIAIHNQEAQAQRIPQQIHAQQFIQPTHIHSVAQQLQAELVTSKVQVQPVIPQIHTSSSRAKSNFLNVSQPKVVIRNSHEVPYGFINRESLSKIMSQYKIKLEELEQLYWELHGSTEINSNSIDDSDKSGRKLFRFKGENLEKIAVFVLESSETLLMPNICFHKIEFLIGWILFNHEVFNSKLPRKLRADRALQNDLLNWLWGEFFYPSSGFPLLGEVHSEKTSFSQDSLSAAQNVLISQLLSLSPKSRAFKYSIKLIGIWYKNFKPELWTSNFRDDEEFWIFMNDAVISTRFSLKYSVKCLRKLKAESTDTPFRFIGDFHVPNPTAYLKSLTQPQALVISKRPALLSLGNYPLDRTLDIIGKVHWIYKARVSHPPQIKSFGTMVVGLAALQKSRLDTDQNMVIRLLNRSKEMIKPSRIKTILREFFQRLEYFSQLLLEALQQEQKEKAKDILEEDLFNWLKDEFFTTKPNEKNPIFGRISPDQFDNSDFSPIQKYLVEYLTGIGPCNELERNIHILAIIGFFYKNTYNKFWKENFIEDNYYWKFVAKVLV